MNVLPTARRPKITKRTIFLVVIINLLLPIVVFSLIMREKMVNDPRMFWILPLTVAICSILMMFISLFAVAIIQKQRLEPLIYLVGQLVVTTAMLGLPFVGLFSRQPAVDVDNRKTLTSHNDTDSFRLRSLEQLENTFKNKNDFEIQESLVEWSPNNTVDSICTVFLTYIIMKSPEHQRTSKHIFKGSRGKLVYSGIPYSENEELMKIKESMNREVLEAMEKFKKDSVTVIK